MNHTFHLVLAILALSLPLARAGEFQFMKQPNDPSVGFGSTVMYNSQGGLLDNSFSFELGTWATGFTPTTANLGSWAANWKVIMTMDSTNGWYSLDHSDPGVNDPNQNVQYALNSVQFNANGTVVGGGSSIFTTGEQAYLWVFNSKTVDPSSEWALVTDVSTGTANDIWSLPNPASMTDVSNQSTYYDLSFADTAVYGQVNGVVGAGTQGADPGQNLLQTFSLTAVVPEPGSALLVLLAGMAVHLRRRPRRV